MSTLPTRRSTRRATSTRLSPASTTCSPWMGTYCPRQVDNKLGKQRKKAARSRGHFAEVRRHGGVVYRQRFGEGLQRRTGRGSQDLATIGADDLHVHYFRFDQDFLAAGAGNGAGGGGDAGFLIHESEPRENNERRT